MSNSNNPFEPSFEGQGQALFRQSWLQLLPWPFSILLAMTLGGCYYQANLQPGDGEIFFAIVVFGAPVGLLLLSTIVMLGSAGSRKWTWSGALLSAVFGVLISLAAFIAFATSCCFTNVWVGGFDVYPERSDWTAGLGSTAVRGGLVTLAATLLGCWIVMLGQRLRTAARNRRRELSLPPEAEP